MTKEKKQHAKLLKETDTEGKELDVQGNDSITDGAISTDEDILTDTEPGVEEDNEENERPDGMRK